MSVAAFQKSMADLLSKSECTLCLEVLQPSTVTHCVNGHVVCKKCRLKVEECPFCKGKFSEFRSRFLESILEILPHMCRFLNCDRICNLGDEHENWCGFSNTQCKRCDWVGFGKDILYHVRTNHKDVKVLGSQNQPEPLQLPLFYSSLHKFLPVYAHGQFFWMKREIDIQKKMWKNTLILIPNGVYGYDMEVDFVLQNNFQKNVSTIYLTKKSLISPEERENSFSIHLSTLEDFAVEESRVHYNLFVKRRSPSS